jgi:CheY-like chemotaxis protein
MNSGKPVILVVEDEVLVRMMAVAIAEDGGFEAVLAQKPIGLRKQFAEEASS